MSDDLSPLASLSLTHVFYNPDDHVSYVCAWLALVPQALCVVYVTLIWSTREAEVALMFAGQMACEAVNLALKRLIKEERPRRIHLTGKGYGMPSSHAQFAFFWAVALSLFLLARHRPPPPPPPPPQPAREQEIEVGSRSHRLRAVQAGIERYSHRPLSTLDRAAASAAAMTLACAVAWSRIYLGYHTEKQVLFGCIAGALSAFGWFAFTYAMRTTGWLDFALQLPLARWCRVRDLVVEEDLCQAGWEKWESKQMVAGQKKGR